jgi:hypothetical protein
MELLEKKPQLLTSSPIRHEHNTHAVIRHHKFRLAECAIGARYGVAILAVSDRKRRTQKSEAAHRMQGEPSLMQPLRQPDVKHTDRYQEGIILRVTMLTILTRALYGLRFKVVSLTHICGYRSRVPASQDCTASVAVLEPPCSLLCPRH